MGFKTIRFFALPFGFANFKAVYDDPKLREQVFYKAIDTAMDLCDKNDIKVVYSLGAGDFTDRKYVEGKGWVPGDEQMKDLVANPQSRSRKYLFQYIDDMVNRYKNRKTILMWEITNELTLEADIAPDSHLFNGEKMPTLKDVATFDDEVAKRIKADDGLHLVTSGGSDMRTSQWNMYTKGNWDRDTLIEHLKAVRLLYGDSAVDVLDIHHYLVHDDSDKVTGPDGKLVTAGFKEYVSFAKMLNKPLYIGELGIQPKVKNDDPENKKISEQHRYFFESYQDETATKWVKQMLDDIVAAGPQLVHWWQYSSDRPVDVGKGSFDLKKGRDDAVLQLIINANKQLKAKLGVPQ